MPIIYINNDDIRLNSSSSDKVVVNGSLGIGTTSPAQKLDVSGNAQVQGILYVTKSGENSRFNSADANGPYVSFRNNGTAKGYIGSGFHLWTSPNNIADNFGIRAESQLDFGIGASVKMTLDSSGNVGIGTTSPSQKLEIHGNVKIGDASADNYVQAVFSDGTETRMHGYGFYMSRTNSYIRPTNDGSQILVIGTENNTWNYVALDTNYFTVSTNASEHLRVTNTGNVGIGTTSPGAKLDVAAGNITAGVKGVKISGNTSYIADGSFGTSLDISHTYSSNDGSFRAINVDLTDAGTNNQTLYGLYVNAETNYLSGNVGIGTTSPHAKLTIDDSNTAGIAQFGIGDISSYYLAMGHNSSGNTDGFIGTVYNNDAARFDIRMKGTAQSDAKVTVLGSGNVGIGTTSPSEKLEVSGNIVSSGYVYATGTSISTFGAALGTFDGSTASSNSFIASELMLGAGGKTGWGTDDILGQIRFYGTDSSGVGARDAAKILAICEEGNGTSTTTFSSGMSFYVSPYNSSAFEALRIKSDGKVGIGTTSPITRLHVGDNTTGVTVRIQNSNAGSEASLRFQALSSTSTQEYADIALDPLAGDGALVFRNPYTSERLRITSDGNVGIGTTSPSAKLHVIGSSTSTDLAMRVANSSNTPFLQVRNDGFVAINHSNFDYTLDVQKFANDNDDTIINIRSNWANTSTDKRIGSLFFTARDVDVDSGATKTAGGIRVFVENEWTSAANSNAYMTFNTLSGGSFGERMRITSAGNVGIGTTTANTLLSIDGKADDGISIQGISTTATRAFFGLDTSGDGYLSLTNGGTFTKNVQLTSDLGVDNYIMGNVGIGTTSPNNFGFLERALHISAGSASSTTLQQAALIIQGSSDADDAVDFGYLAFTNYQSTLANNRVAEIRALRGDTVDKGQLTFFTANGATVEERLRITPTGNVGIGTTSPSSTLEIRKATATHQLVSLNRPDSDVAAMYLGNDSSSPANGVVASNYSDLILGRDQSGTLTEHVRIKRDGNVGIGTTSPAVKLDVQGQVRVNTTTAVPSAASMIIGGVQNASSSAALQVGGFIRIGYFLGIHDQFTPGSSFGITYNSSGLTLDREGGSLSGNILLATTTGNVGIGTTSPYSNAKLQVKTGTNINVAVQTGTTNTSGIKINAFNDAGDTNIPLELNGSILSLKTGETERMHITSSGNVGIGTTSPTSKLDVNGSGYFNGNLSIKSQGVGNSLSILESTTGNLALYAGESAVGHGFLALFEKSVGEVIRLDANANSFINRGNVGIGTTSPSEKLDVLGNIKLGDGGTGAALKYNSTNRGTILVNGSEIMRLEAAGNVGIGTTSPQTPLQIDKNVVGQSTLLTLQNNATHTIGNTAGISFNVWSSETARIEAIAETASARTGLAFSTHTGGTYGERLRIDGLGNVGIGTTSPSTKLHILQSGTAVSSDGVSSLVVQKSAAAATAAAINIVSGDSAEASLRFGDTTDQSMGALRYLNDADAFSIVTNNNEQVRITSAGYVGIGTTSPVATLEVEAASTVNGTELAISNDYGESNKSITFRNGSDIIGQISTYGRHSTAGAGPAMTFKLSDGTSAVERLRITKGGNVGIGTTSPDSKLHAKASGNGTYIFRGMSSSGTDLGGLYQSTAGDGEIYLKTSAVSTNVRISSNNVTYFNGGNVGIGTTSPDSKFHVEDTNPEVRITGTGGTSFPRILWEYPVSATQASRWALTSSASGNTFYLYNYTQSKKVFQVDGTASHITLNHDAAGTTQIGTSTTQTAYQLYVATNVGQTGAIEASGSVKITSGALGVNIAASATAGRIDASNDIVAYSTSDKRLKENIKPIENALDKVKSLTGVEFDWIEETKHVHGYEGHDVGVIAQEVQEVLPEAIRTNDSGYLSVRYEKLIGLLIESNKELAARIEILEQKLKQ